MKKKLFLILFASTMSKALSAKATLGYDGLALVCMSVTHVTMYCPLMLRRLYPEPRSQDEGRGRKFHPDDGNLGRIFATN